MKPGNMVQVQRAFRVFERVVDRRDPKTMQEIVSLMVSPGEIYLLTKIEYHKQEYPQYDYVTIELLIAGRTWLTTITLDDKHELDKFIKDYDFKNLDIKSFESPMLLLRG